MRCLYIQMYVYAIDDNWTSRNCFWFPISKLAPDRAGDFYYQFYGSRLPRRPPKKQLVTDLVNRWASDGWRQSMQPIGATSLGLIVFQFNSYILQWFYGVINSRNKGDASSDSIKESRQWVAGNILIVSNLLFWFLICIHWNWWILVVSNWDDFGLKIWCNWKLIHNSN